MDMLQSMNFWPRVIRLLSVVLFLSISGCGQKKPIVLPDGQLIYLLEASQNPATKAISTRILTKDSQGKSVSFAPQDYLKVNGYYVLSPGLLLQIANLLVKEDPALAAAILKANQ